MNHLPQSRLHSCYNEVIKDISLGSQSVSHVMHAFHVIIIVGPTRFAQDVLYTCKIREFLRLNDAPTLLITLNQNTLISGIATPGILLISAKLVGLNSQWLTLLNLSISDDNSEEA